MILVTGGAGVMGSCLVRGLAAAGHAVRAMALPGDPNLGRLRDVPCEVVTGDVTQAATLAGVFDGVTTVYHLAGIILAATPETLHRVNAEGTRNVVAAAGAAGARHLVYVSSASVTWPEGSAYAQSKLAAEEAVRGQRDVAWTIVRPTLVYDNAGGGEELALFAAGLRRFPVVPFVGRGRARKSPVHADDVAHALLAMAENPRTHGQVYNLSGGEEISIWDLAKLILAREGLDRPFLPIPVPLCRAAAWVMERTMATPLLTSYAISRIVHEAALDHTAARRDLGYDPIGVSQGLVSSRPLPPQPPEESPRPLPPPAPEASPRGVR